VDSESDDFSLDDSASDRSDGSDYEPFSAARVIALNRMQQQQQQRLQQIRVQSLGQLRPHGEMEYQSGDSMDSTMAEDSGGSDSSSSDLAD
jgi:predicted PP-loop superfamily ATPase